MNATRNRSQQRWGTMFAAATLIATVGAIARPGAVSSVHLGTITKEQAMAELSSKSASSTDMPQPGRLAPDFTAQDDAGNIVRLADLRGKKVVLYFYPKDDTPGCTKEACAFRDGFSELRKRGAVVYGVSIDSVASHAKFKQKFQLNFPLLSDTDKKLVDAYGVWKQKSMYGRSFMGIERTTFLIDEQGKIAKVFPRVKVNEHYEEVLAAL